MKKLLAGLCVLILIALLAIAAFFTWLPRSAPPSTATVEIMKDAVGLLTVLAEGLAVIRGEDHERFVEQAEVPGKAQDLADVAIEYLSQ